MTGDYSDEYADEFELNRHGASPVMCPKCSTDTWTRNVYTVRCRYCDHVWNLKEGK